MRKGVDALVLSAGGMLGAWQAGVWKGLEGVFRPEMVVGASVGALNGWMIACGHPGAELVRRWLELDGFARLQWRIPRSPLEGFMEPDRAEELIQSVYEAGQARVPIGVVATELATLRPRVFRTEELTWRHLAASCAVFGLMPQYRLNGRRFTDGGLLGALPLWAAAEMGARRIVAIHAQPVMPWVIRGPLKALRAATGRRRGRPPWVGVTVIAPERKLGGLREMLCWNRENARAWLKEGEREGLRLAEAVNKFLI